MSTIATKSPESKRKRLNLEKPVYDVYSDGKSKKEQKNKKEKGSKRKTEESALASKKKRLKISKAVEEEGLSERESEEGSEILNNPYLVSNFRISEGLKQKLKAKGIEALFPIQALTFDGIFEGNDLVGRARTGQVFVLFCLIGNIPFLLLFRKNCPTGGLTRKH